jgi:hypothetical protein
MIGEAGCMELPCFISLSLVPTARPVVSGRLFLSRPEQCPAAVSICLDPLLGTGISAGVFGLAARWMSLSARKAFP